MPELLPAGSQGVQWEALATTARLAVTDPAALVPAQHLVERQIAAVQRASSRRRPDAEIHKLDRATGRPVRISPLLAELVAAALAAASRTDGDVDPTVARTPIASLGCQRDLSVLPVCGSSIGPRSVPRWRRVRLAGRSLTVPPGTALDLGAVAPRFAADRCAAEVAQRLGTGVLVGLAGDVATAGPAPLGGWMVPLGGGSGDPTVTLSPGTALATAHGPGQLRLPGHRPGSRVPVHPSTPSGAPPRWWRSAAWRPAPTARPHWSGAPRRRPGSARSVSRPGWSPPPVTWSPSADGPARIGKRHSGRPARIHRRARPAGHAARMTTTTTAPTPPAGDPTPTPSGIAAGARAVGAGGGGDGRDPARVGVVLDVVVPVYNEEARPRALRPHGCTPTSSTALPLPVPDHRSRTTPAPTARWRSRPAPRRRNCRGAG